MFCDVRDGRSFDPHGHVMPSDPAAGGVLLAVVRIAAVVREVDASDERDPVVDHDRLLVVAVHVTDTRVQLALDVGPPAEALRHRAHVAT